MIMLERRTVFSTLKLLHSLAHNPKKYILFLNIKLLNEKYQNETFHLILIFLFLNVNFSLVAWILNFILLHNIYVSIYTSTITSIQQPLILLNIISLSTWCPLFIFFSIMNSPWIKLALFICSCTCGQSLSEEL